MPRARCRATTDAEVVGFFSLSPVIHAFERDHVKRRPPFMDDELPAAPFADRVISDEAKQRIGRALTKSGPVSSTLTPWERWKKRQLDEMKAAGVTGVAVTRWPELKKRASNNRSAAGMQLGPRTLALSRD